MTYEEYEQQCKSERESNEEYLKEFESDMNEDGLSANTISRHLSNIDFYINEYLLREEPLGMREGCYRVDDFLGYFFIRKCMWSTPGTIKSTAASLKKFYKYMVSKGNIQKDEYQELCDTIKENMDVWQDSCERFNNPSLENPFGYI
ncbi:MAG: recombinase [Firmicutes bacterium HGW-Firmicutes-7]|nr:MAG: recombinase [Firmicutes bacterium HGW-Firmicutes-7]